MASTRYLRSTDGNDGDSGATWALAKATITGLAAIDTSGDSLYVSQAHSESVAGINVSFAGTLGAPTRLICANDAAEPPTAVAATALIESSGSNNIAMQGASAAYIYGITFNVGAGGSSGNFSSTMANAVWEACNFQLANSGASATINLTGNGPAKAKDCGFKFANAGQTLRHDLGLLHLQGGSILAGGTSPTTFIAPAAATNFLIEGFDFSNAAVGLNLVASIVNRARGIFRNCKLPASWSGVLHSATPGIDAIYEMFNCDSGDTNYRYRKAAQFGTIQDETTIVRSGGASNGATSWSLKMVSNANAIYPTNTLDCPERVQWNDLVGAPVTLTVEIVRDSLTALTDAEIWVDVEYLGTSGFPISSVSSDAPASVLTAAANQAVSTETWTTTGLVNPNKQKLVATFTPQEVGYVHYTVRLAKASATVYVDPKATIAVV